MIQYTCRYITNISVNNLSSSFFSAQIDIVEFLTLRKELGVKMTVRAQSVVDLQYKTDREAFRRVSTTSSKT